VNLQLEVRLEFEARREVYVFLTILEQNRERNGVSRAVFGCIREAILEKVLRVKIVWGLSMR